MELDQIKWIDKYRPKNLDELILPERIKKRLVVDLPMLFYGPAGCGKTSAALAKCSNPLIINCSKDGSVKQFENISNYALEYSLLGENEQKLVVLDEIEGVSSEFFKGLRGVMDTYTHVNWIATTNYINKINVEGITSRFNPIDFSLTDEEVESFKPLYTKKLIEIALAEKVKIKKNVLIRLIEKSYPDFRSAIMSLQILHKMNGGEEITLDDVESNVVSYTELYEMINSKVNDSQLFTYVLTNYSSKVDEVFTSLGRGFIDYLMSIGKDKIIGEVGIMVHKYSYESRICIDKPLALYCCIKELNNICNQ